MTYFELTQNIDPSLIHQPVFIHKTCITLNILNRNVPIQKYGKYADTDNYKDNWLMIHG